MSRALHSPGRLVRDLTWEIPPTFNPATNFFYGFKASDNPNLKYETTLSRELGYRVELADKVWVDFAGYLNKYDDMLIFEFAEAGLRFVPVPHILINYQIGNALKYETKGLELTTRWAPLPDWQLEGSWAWVDVKKDFDVASAFFPADDTVPANTFTVRSRSSLGSRVTLDGSATYVSRMVGDPNFGDSEPVDSYTRVDANVDWRLTPDVSLAATGQNLLGAHVEATGTLGFAYSGAIGPRAALSVPRNLGLSLRWRF
jgi:iron complex outermembrane receptor protein